MQLTRVIENSILNYKERKKETSTFIITLFLYRAVVPLEPESGPNNFVPLSLEI